ncbi:MAG: antitoxin Xre/MbcA/ParS toxin-binding domain-containing protein [Cyclobacteriaceae bacterium]
MYAQDIGSYIHDDSSTSLESPFDLVKLARRGVSRKTLRLVSEGLGIPVKDLVPKLPIAERTIQRYGLEDYLPAHVSEQIIQWAQLLAFGRSVFTSEAVFQDWMRQPNRALGENRPLDLLDTRQGVELLLQLLGQIEHGVYR